MTAEPRVTLFVRLDALARQIAAANPGARVGFAVSVVDDDWGIFVNGPAILRGHGERDLARAEAEHVAN